MYYNKTLTDQRDLYLWLTNSFIGDQFLLNKKKSKKCSIFTRTGWIWGHSYSDPEQVLFLQGKTQIKIVSNQTWRWWRKETAIRSEWLDENLMLSLLLVGPWALESLVKAVKMGHQWKGSTETLLSLRGFFPQPATLVWSENILLYPVSIGDM